MLCEIFSYDFPKIRNLPKIFLLEVSRMWALVIHSVTVLILHVDFSKDYLSSVLPFEMRSWW